MTFVENAFRNIPAWVQVNLAGTGQELKLVVAHSITAEDGEDSTIIHFTKHAWHA